MKCEKSKWLDDFLKWTTPIEVHTRVLVFDFGDEENVPQDWAIPMLRGAWGNALHILDRTVYDEIFEGPGGKTNRLPLYLVRDDLDHAARIRKTPPGMRSIQWTLFCQSPALDEIFFRAWETACRNGFGEHRNTCSIVHTETCASQICDPAFLEAARPCRVVFPHPLRLIRKGVLNQKPTLYDIVQAILNRLACFRTAALCEDRKELILPAVPGTLLPEFAREILAFAQTLPAEPWHGIKHGLRRYSGRQKSEIRLNGTSGYLTFPAGLGPLAAVLGAASVSHIGKGTVYGMGRPFLLPLEDG